MTTKASIPNEAEIRPMQEVLTDAATELDRIIAENQHQGLRTAISLQAALHDLETDAEKVLFLEVWLRTGKIR